MLCKAVFSLTSKQCQRGHIQTMGQVCYEPSDGPDCHQSGSVMWWLLTSCIPELIPLANQRDGECMARSHRKVRIRTWSICMLASKWWEITFQARFS